MRKEISEKKKSSKTISSYLNPLKKRRDFSHEPQKLTKMITESFKAPLIMVMNHELQ